MKKLLIFALLITFFGCNNADKIGKLKITGDYNIMIQQRDYKKIKGNITDITIKLGDITSGRVNVSITDKKEINIEQVMESGEILNFDYYGTEYSFEINELINHLIDEDYAELTLRENTGKATQLEKVIEKDSLIAIEKKEVSIEAFIDSVENSGLTFIRNGDEYTSVQAAKHLRKKLKNSGKVDNISFSEFVNAIASKSSMSGKAYKIKLDNNTEILFSDWIKENFRTEE